MTTKQKNIRDYIIGFSIICVLIVALIVTRDIKDQDEDVTEEQSDSYIVIQNEGKTITDMKTSDISKVTYTLKDKEPVVFEKKTGTWVLNGDEEFPLSVDSFEKQFLKKYVDGVVYEVVEEYDSLADYGIDDPEVTLEVVGNDNSVRTYLVGAYNGVIDAYYMYHKEEDVLYTATGDFLFICRDDIYDFAGIDNFPSFSTDSLEMLVMNNGQKKVEMVYFKDGHETDPFGNSVWYILSPFNFYRACDAQSVTDNFEEVFSGLGFSKKVDYYATEDELKEYGLLNTDKYFEIVYKYDESTSQTISGKVTIKVAFGNYIEEEDAYYARILLTQGMEVNAEMAHSINLISREAADRVLNLDPVDYIYPFVFYVPMKEFAGAGIKITKNDGTAIDVGYEATYIEGISKASNEKIYVNGVDTDVDAFKEFYYQFTKIYVNRPIYESDKIVTVEPTYVINYDRIEDDFYGDAVVEYRIFDATYYQVTINGMVDALAVRRDVDKAIKMLEELVK